MTSTSVARAARAEKRAEGDREAAENALRAAWWKTTVALAKEPSTPRTELSQTLREVETILGQSTMWIKLRRATGRAFSMLKHAELQDLPPRKAAAVVENKVPVTAEVIEMLRDSDELRLRDKAYPTRETLRAFSERLTGVAWSVGSDAQIEKALESKPELARKIASKVIESDPTVVEHAVASQPEAVGRAVAKSTEATASYADTRRAETEEKRERIGVGPSTPTPSKKEMSAKVAARNAVSDWMNLVHEGQAKLRAALSQWEAVQADLIAEDLTEVNASLVEAEGDAGILRQRVADHEASLSDTNV